ncbi:MAG: ribonuclease P protein component [Clostridiales bacterium]
MLAKIYRLKEKKDFRRVYQRGKSYAYPYFVLYSRGNNLANYRVGFSVSKKVGKAVIRNKVKRRFRAAAKENHQFFLPGKDYIFILRNPSVRASYNEICKQMEKALGRLSSDIKDRSSKKGSGKNG